MGESPSCTPPGAPVPNHTPAAPRNPRSHDRDCCWVCQGLSNASLCSQALVSSCLLHILVARRMIDIPIG